MGGGVGAGSGGRGRGCGGGGRAAGRSWCRWGRRGTRAGRGGRGTARVGRRSPRRCSRGRGGRGRSVGVRCGSGASCRGRGPAEAPSRTAGMIPARQASRRASPAESRAPVSRDAAARPPMRASRVMVTTTVAHTPPALPHRGGGPGLDVLAERLPQPVPGLLLGVRRRPGLWARRCLRSIWPCRAGIVNRPWQRPWPSSTIVNDAAARAACSSASSTRASWASPISGATTSRIRRPSTRNAFASWSRGVLERAPPRPRPPPRGRPGRRGGRRPRPRSPPPGPPTAPRPRGRSGPARGRRPTGPPAGSCRCASARVTFAVWDHQVAVEVAPWSRPTSTDVGVPGDPELQLGTWARSRVSSSSVAAASSRLIDHNDTSARSSRSGTRGGHEPRDPMPRIGTQHAFGHDPSQAPATDSPGRSEPLVHKGNLIAAVS